MLFRSNILVRALEIDLKMPNPQMLRQGPVMNWRLIQGMYRLQNLPCNPRKGNSSLWGKKNK